MILLRNVFLRLALGLALLLTASVCWGQQSKFHALFITKFSESIQWPDGGNTVVIGVVGETQAYTYLQNFCKSKPHLSTVQVTSEESISQCKILYFPKTEDTTLKGYLDFIGNKSILVVSENDKMAGNGADIAFYLENGRMRFLVDKESMESKKLNMGSNLLGRGKVL